MSIDQVLGSFWSALTPRQHDIVTGRFGVDRHAKPKTLAALGTKYGITRERVRQIESSALAILREKIEGNRDARALVEKAKKCIKDHGGVMAADKLLGELKKSTPDLTANALLLLARASRAFDVHQEDDAWRPFYYLDNASLKSLRDFVGAWEDTLHTKKEDVLKGKYRDLLADLVRRKKVTAKHADAFLALSKKFHVNPYGDVGLAEWGEIKPSTVRDQIYLVLKKHAAPLHFAQIATAINQARISARPALAPTVHNELIKDDRFVLVGRGMYALAEHGYVPGNAREVIHRVLKRHGALRPRDIILAVQKERFFKPNTILVNLQNRDAFVRKPDGTYRVREA